MDTLKMAVDVFAWIAWRLHFLKPVYTQVSIIKQLIISVWYDQSMIRKFDSNVYRYES